MKPLVQRRGEEEELQMKPLVQRRVGPDGGDLGAQAEQSIQQTQGRGQELPDRLRSSMEEAFGADFSGVRVHNDAESDDLNDALQARAFTTGQDIYLRQSEYNPANGTGQKLLAHELTHVVQQSGSLVLREPVSGIVQRELKKEDIDKLVAADKHNEALELICKEYGFTGDNFEIKVVDSMADAWATTGGEIKEGAKQTLSIGKDLFEQSLVFIVRTIGHEFQHLKQRSQKDPIQNQKEREFLAWAWEALDTSVPSYEQSVAAKHAEKSLEYFNDMPEDRKPLYEAKKKDLEKLIEKATVAAGR